MTARPGILPLLLAALSLPAFASIPRTPPVVEKPHQGIERFALTLHRERPDVNLLIAPRFAPCVCDEDRRSRSTGKERDAETGLDYFLARYHSGAQGRFTSADPKSGWPSDPQSWNMYAYGRNNPLLYTDPDGQTYRICQVGSDGKETNCTEQKNELTDSQFNQFQKDNKGNMSFSGGKIYTRNDDGSRTQTGTYKQTDVDLNDAGQELFQGNKQLWHNSATVVNTAAVATGALMALPVAAEVAALPSMEVAVGNNFFGGWHVAFRASGGPWLHGMNLGAEGAAVTVTEAGAARFAGKALFNFSLKILRPGPVNAMGAGAGAAAGSCFRAACAAFLKGWGLK